MPTDNEIIKALECCSKMSFYHIPCENCPAIHENCLGGRILIKQALDLINRQKAENEMLQIKIEGVQEANAILREHIKKAVKEFAERLKKQAEVYTDFDEDVFRLAVGISKIDNLLKEMVGDS